MNKSKLSAVVLKYPEFADAPVITAKATGDTAKKIIELAKENNIPVVKDDVAENILSAAEIGECIPESAWQCVAAILAFVKKMEGKK